MQRREIVHERGKPSLLELAGLQIDEERRPDLHDDTAKVIEPRRVHGAADRWSLVRSFRSSIPTGYHAFGARTSTPARFSIGLMTSVMSLSDPSSSQVSLRRGATASMASTGTPRALASEMNRFTSFSISPAVKP